VNISKFIESGLLSIMFTLSFSVIRERNTMINLLRTTLAASLFLVSFAAQACSLAAWDATSGAISGGPDDAHIIVRYAGECAMDGTAGTVTNNGVSAAGGPTDEPRMISRFYFLATGSGDATLFQAFADNAATTAIYTVSFDGTHITVTPNDGGLPAMAAVGNTNWHSVEIDWTQGGAIQLWVDSDANTDAADASGMSGDATSVINAALLGGIGGAGGFTQLLFDDYVSNKTTAIGRAMVGDASGDNNVDITDVIATINEVLGSSVNTGTPDCDENGVINISDVICTINVVLSS